VQCTRKTEVRSWHTLFQYLPSPHDLFDESLGKGQLKTAGGYLLVMQTLEDLSTEEGTDQAVRLMTLASEKRDWELCKELARFLMAMDESGDSLRRAMASLNLEDERPHTAVATNGQGGEKGKMPMLSLPSRHRRRHSRSPPLSETGLSSRASDISQSSLASGGSVD